MHRCLLLYDCCLVTPNPQMFPFQLANSQCTVVYLYHKDVYLYHKVFLPRQNVVYLRQNVVYLQQNVVYLSQNVVYLHHNVVYLRQNVVLAYSKSQMRTFARLAQLTLASYPGHVAWVRG